MKLGFDLISDLNLSPNDEFDWENKATSLYCLVAGNISDDFKTVIKTLHHLSSFYQGVFYIPGSLEYKNTEDIDKRTNEICRTCLQISNVAVLHQHVVIIDGVAILGVNGWYGNYTPEGGIDELHMQGKRHEDIFYLRNSLNKLQKHLDVKKILILSNSVPGENLYFGEIPNDVRQQLPLNLTLETDTEHKISHWAFGTYGKIVDTAINDINYVNNPKLNRDPYWAKRIEVEV